MTMKKRTCATALVLLAILALILPNGSAARPNPPEDGKGVMDPPIEVKGRVLFVTPLTRYEGTLRLAARDPKFALGFELLEDCPALELDKGEEARFAVHSIVKLFADDDVVGRTFVFEIGRKELDGKLVYELGVKP